MIKKPTKIIGLEVSAFDNLVQSGEEIHLRPARLLNFHKPGDELAVTSIFLSGIKLIKEFRRNIFNQIKLTNSNTIRFYTEVQFFLFDGLRIDGLILIIKSNKIVDAVLIEVKNKKNELDEAQLTSYLKISKEYNIPNFLTISNQFVNFPTQSPLIIKVPTQISLYHLSWTYILTASYLLLAKNEINIENYDQKELMKEMVNYFESKESGIIGLTQVKQGWVELTQKINTKINFKPTEAFVVDTVASWIQIERCMALALSRELLTLVESGKRKFKDDLKGRLKYEQKELTDNFCLESIYKIDGAASQLKLSAHFDTKTIEYSVELSAPSDKKNRGKITWIKKQLEKSETKNKELFNQIKDNIFIEISCKYSKNPIKIKLLEINSDQDQLNDKEITGFKIMYILSLSHKFEGRKKILELIEQNLMKFYQGVVQHLKKWEKPAPQIIKKDEFNDMDEIQSDGDNDKSVTFDEKVGNVLTNWKKKGI